VLFAKYLTPAETAEIRRRQLGHKSHLTDWPSLVGLVSDDFDAGTPADSDCVLELAKRWQQLFRDSYCGEDAETTHRWEMSGLAALQPATVAQWYGEWKEGEMQIEVIGKDPTGNQIRNRFRFFLIESNRFSWENKISLDDGKTWLQASSLTATRAVR
jgi:hypothetical protein